MITNQQIEELNEVIGYLNQAESLSDEDLVDKVENIRSLAKILTRIKTFRKIEKARLVGGITGRENGAYLRRLWQGLRRCWQLF